MSDVKISALPAASSVTAADLLVIVQGGVTDKATVAQVLAVLPVMVPASVTKSANYTIVGATDYQIEMITNTGFTVTLPAAPSGCWQFVIVNTAAGNNTVGGNGHNLSSTGSTSMTLAAGQAVTCTWSTASSTWLCT